MTINIDALTSAIINIPCKRDDESFRDVASRLLYKEGHRDARHSAVELVLAASAAQEGGVTSREGTPQQAAKAETRRHSLHKGDELSAHCIQNAVHALV